MTKYLSRGLLILLLSASIQGQTIHQRNVETVSQAYWNLLGRAPDASGLMFWTYEMDRRTKDPALIDYAFRVSGEYQNASKHPLECKADYSAKRNFAEIRYSTPQELITLRGAFKGRGLVGEGNLGPLVAAFGNTIELRTTSCSYIFWYDYAALDFSVVGSFVSELPNSKEIEVTYDPITGLAKSVEILSYR